MAGLEPATQSPRVYAAERLAKGLELHCDQQESHPRTDVRVLGGRVALRLPGHDDSLDMGSAQLPSGAMTPADVLKFWFEELKPLQWFKADPALDAEIAKRFGALHASLGRSVPPEWRTGARETLAAVIVLDQFSRNIHRGDQRAFANDAAALSLASEAIGRGEDRALNPVERQFLYMPFQHAENAAVQERSVALFEAVGDANATKYAHAHRDIIVRFGRFPHRNAILGRASTQEEVAFLKQPGSSF